MTHRLLAYAAYAAGSAVFLGVALSRGSLLIAAGSALFLCGTLLLLAPQVVVHRRRGGLPAHGRRR